MTRRRLRDARPEGEGAFYSSRYPTGYCHDVWPDHVERVKASVDLIRRYSGSIHTAADLSAGDAAILRGLPSLDRVWVGDLNGVDQFQRGWNGSTTEVTALPPGALPTSLDQLPQQVDLFVCSETLEHLDDPDALLARLPLYARYLFLSTPVAEEGNGNEEHYWSWNQADVHHMLQDAGWSAMECQILHPLSTRSLPGAYTYQLWMAVSR